MPAKFSVYCRGCGMYAVVATGGKQYKVSLNQKICVEKIELPVGDTVVLDKVLLVADGEDVKVGTPCVEGAKVVAEVVDQIRGAKINIIKFRRRKHYMRRQGHRQYHTVLLIREIA